MNDRDPEHTLPKPFYDDGWPRDRQHHAKALWDFHRSLVNADAPALDGEDLTAYFEAERDHALAAEPLNLVTRETTKRAYEAINEHGLPRELLGRQIMAARAFKDPIRFSGGPEVNAFIADWANAHGRMLSHLADVTGSWQLRYVDEFSTAFFWVGRLVTLNRDLGNDWLFIPMSDLEQAGVSIGALRSGAVDEAIKRLLWKQTIRAKDAFAQSEQLVLDLPRRYANEVKRWWIAGLEVLNEIRRRGYDVWSEPITLSTFHKLQIRFQARFGRTTFRSR